jgi:hypothetical protein
MTRKVPTNLFPLTENFFIFFVVCSVSISHNGVKEEEEKKLLDMNCANIQETMRVKKNLSRHCDKSRRLESIFLFF